MQTYANCLEQDKAPPVLCWNLISIETVCEGHKCWSKFTARVAEIFQIFKVFIESKNNSIKSIFFFLLLEYFVFCGLLHRGQSHFFVYVFFCLDKTKINK